MILVFVEESWEDYLYWQATDKQLLARINQLIKDISRDPFKGIGKPELLKGDLKGYWSRRITDEHRLVYKVESDEYILIISVKGHYGDK